MNVVAVVVSQIYHFFCLTTFERVCLKPEIRNNIMNKESWIREMKKWVSNMTPKEKSDFDNGIKEMKRMKGTR